MILRGERTIWLLVVLPAFITAAAMQINYVLVRQACSAQRNLALYVVSIVALALLVGVGVISFLNWRQEGSQWPGETADVATRTRFISIMGALESGLFFLVTLAQGIATIYFDPCQP